MQPGGGADQVHPGKNGAMVDLHAARREYAGHPITDDISSPWPLFTQWFDHARQAERAGELVEASAMNVATVDPDGQPSIRVVLLKAFSPDFGEHGGFDFYSHATSRKGLAIDHEPRVGLHFYWSAQNRQVRIEGSVEVKPRAEAEAYWRARPKASQVAAWVSHQSHPRESRTSLESAFVAATAGFLDRDVPCPEDWRGYRVSPQRFEFWQGMPSRLHDRISSERQPDGSWVTGRLDP